MSARLRPAPAEFVTPAVKRFRAGAATPEDLRLLTRHFLALLAERSPGRAVEVRVPPYAAVQCVGGTTHTRGTPPAVVETDPETWVALALGELGWQEAEGSGRVLASGERSDLGALLPLTSQP